MARRRDESRLAQAHARARGAKAVIASGALLVFGVAFVGARMHAPGHAKGRAKPLAAPKSFERAVKRSVTEGGQIAPAIQPPPVSTATS
jgi:hypothetical protein